MQNRLKAQLFPKASPYAVLHPTFDQGHDDGEYADEFALILPLECRPDGIEGQSEEAVEVIVNKGVAQWVGARGVGKQIGSKSEPLDQRIVDALLSEDGLIVFFVETFGAELTSSAIFYGTALH